MKITILDPAMCCSTGVCGVDVDEELVLTSANVKWLKSLGYDVQRHNISNDATSFKKFSKAIEKLQKEGANSLPYIFINDELVMHGRYPERSDWESWIQRDNDKNPENEKLKSADNKENTSSSGLLFWSWMLLNRIASEYIQPIFNLLKTTPYLFFTGKGGVGKTSLACATAIELADGGNKVLLVSTDPASNLEDVLESKVTEEINQIAGVENLYAININPEVSAEQYRDRVTGPLSDILPEAEIRKMKEELSGACTTEIAAFDEFSRFISGEYEGAKFDVIIFDTAPTGHTLRLLELPAAWAEFTEENPDGASCLGPSSALKSSQARYKKVVETPAGQRTNYILFGFEG